MLVTSISPNIGVNPGGDPTPGGPGNKILLENGNFILLENGSGLLLLEA